MSEEKKNFIRQGSILALAGIAVRIIGMLYRIPLANIIGDEGNGIYSVAYNVYNIAMVLSAYGLPMAVSKLLSMGIAKKQYRNTIRIFQVVLAYAILAGGIAALMIYFGADYLAQNVYSGYAGIQRPLRVLAPTVFIVAVLGTLRGFFQGHHTMVPTAISQIIEQIVNATVSIIAAYSLVKANFGSTQIASYGAMGSTWGTFAGALSALIFVGCLFSVQYKNFYGQRIKDNTGVLYGYKKVIAVIAGTTIPIVLGQTFYQISAVFDDIMYGKIMVYRNVQDTIISSMSGVYNSIYILLIGIPMGIASAMASSTLPSIAASMARGMKEEVRSKIHSAIAFNMMIAIPSAVGLAVLGQEVAELLFPRLDYVMGGRMLRYGSVAVVFFAFSTITNSILQAVNKVNKPVIHSMISLIIHLVVVSTLMVNTNMGIYALVFGYVTFPLVVAILNLRSLKKAVGYEQEIRSTFVEPFICAAIMGIAAFVVYYATYWFCKSNAISIIIALFVALVVYFLPMYRLGNLKRFR